MNKIYYVITIMLILGNNPTLKAQTLREDVHYLSYMSRKQLYHSIDSLMLSWEQNSESLSSVTTQSDSLNYLNTKQADIMSLLIPLNRIKDKIELDSLFGISIGINCFDSLVIHYTQMLLKKEAYQDNIVLLDILRVYNTLLGTYYIEDKIIYRDFIKSILLSAVLNQLAFVKNDWDACYFSKRHNMIVLYGYKQGFDSRIRDYLINSKYALRYNEN